MSQHGVPDHFRSSRHPEGTMDLVIETLTGTAFEMTVSPFETIISIKTKIQRVEGIPVSQQHLLYKLIELEDSSSLMDHSIQNGDTLQLVLTLRGGPISTRRAHSEEEMSWKELRDLMEQNISEHKRDDVLDYIPPGCRVTVLVLREGDQVNLFRVLENEDGTYSPLSDTLSSSSRQNVFLEGEQEKPRNEQRQFENTVTRFRMEELKSRMKALSVSKKSKKKTIPPLVSAKRTLGLPSGPLEPMNGAARVPTLSLNQGEPEAAYGPSETWGPQFSESLHLPPIQKAETTTVPSRQRAIASSYLCNSSMLNEQPSRRSRETEGGASGNVDNNPSNSHPVLGASRREIKTPSQSRRPPLVPLCPTKRSGARRRPTANPNLDARRQDCIDYGLNRTLHRHNSSTGSASGKESKSSSLVSTSKIAIVEPEGESSVDKVESDLRVNRSSIQIPVSVSEATTTTYAIARERVTTSVGGAGRYRLAEVVLSTDDEDEEEGCPNTSPDKLTPQQKCTQELCNILSETKWHRRQQVNCPSIEDLSDLAQGSQQPVLMKTRAEQDDLPLDLAMPDCSVLDGPLLGTPSLLQYSQRGLLLPLMNDSKGGEHQTLTNIDGDSESRPLHGARRRVPQEQPSSTRDAKTLPLIVPEGKKVRQRCAECRKRLKLTNMYTCRCEKLFCAAHRYSELHNCTFDYKTEGRKLLEQSNPLVTAPKLPKI